MIISFVNRTTGEYLPKIGDWFSGHYGEAVEALYYCFGEHKCICMASNNGSHYGCSAVYNIHELRDKRYVGFVEDYVWK